MKQLIKEHVYKAFYLCCGIGAGALGFQQAKEEYKGIVGRFRTIGAIDAVPEICQDFDYITGSKSTCLDLFSREQYVAFHGEQPPEGWKEATPEDIREACGGEYPDIVFTSPPCKGFSGLLPEESAESEKYQALNKLTIRTIRLTCEAFKDDLPSLILLENVPRITTRGKELLREIKKVLKEYGYVFAEGYHDCGEIGGLAQHRKRYLLIARNPRKLPGFVYEPPAQRVKEIGEVLEDLPLPGDVSMGPMHRVPRLQWKTWVRLALIPAGGDWRDLEETTASLGHKPRAGAYRIIPWEEPSTTVTGATSGVGQSNGASAVADPRIENVQGYGNKYQVVRWDEPCITVTGSRVGSGAPMVSDPRKQNRHTSHYRVVPWNEPSGTVTGASHVANGLISVQDVRVGCKPRSGTYGVMEWDKPASTVIGSADVHAGTAAVADPRIPKETENGVWIIISEDGTWHRPLTTLELSVLQGLPTHINGEPLKLAGNNDSDWRERIGNAVPVPAATEIANTMLRAMLPALKGEIMLGWTPIWVKPGIGFYERS